MLHKLIALKESKFQTNLFSFDQQQFLQGKKDQVK